MSWKERIWSHLQPATGGDRSAYVLEGLILSLILLNVVALVIESVDALEQRWRSQLVAFEAFSVAVFSVEYLLRLWSCTADPRYRRPFAGRAKYAVTFLALVDLMAVLPFYLSYIAPDLRCLRALRLLRIVRVAKLGRYVRSLELLSKVVRGKREELALTTLVMLILLFIASALMHHVESPIQPESFPNIPSAMWWAVATMTTVGYGDVYPISAAGKVLGSFVALLGVAFFALPAGLLGSGFVAEIQRRRRVTRCPHCGASIADEESD